MKHVRARILAEEIGFTPRHWIRLASKGMLPGAYQPSGPGGQWMFDFHEIRRWMTAKRIGEDNAWQQNIKGVPFGGPVPSETAKNSGKALRPEIDSWLKSACDNGSKTSTPSHGATVHELRSGKR